MRQTIDENGQATTIDYYPESLRHLKTTRPDGGYTQTDYGDGVQRFARNNSLIDSSEQPGRFLTNIQLFNGRDD